MDIWMMKKLIFQILLLLASILGAYYYGDVPIGTIILILVTTPIFVPRIQKILFPGSLKDNGKSPD